MQKNKRLQSILTNLAQTAALPSEIDLWPGIQVRLAEEQSFSQTGRSVMKPKLLKTSRYRFAIAGGFTILIALAMLLIFPQGQAWAQTLFHFFIQTGDQVALPTAEPVDLVALTPGALQPTLTQAAGWQPPFFDSCGDLTAPRCSFTQIQEMAGFPVKGLAALPQGGQFVGATGGPHGVTLVYLLDGSSARLTLDQGQPAPGDEGVQLIGSSAVVEPVQVGRVEGEYVKGGYFHTGGDRVANWDVNAGLQSLRWEVDGISFALTLSSAPELPGTPLDRDALTALAATLTGQPGSAALLPIPDSPRSADEAAQAAGFAVIEPAWLPEGYRFASAAYLPEAGIVCLEYQHPTDQAIGDPLGSPAPSLSIAESVSAPLPVVEDLTVPGLRADQVLLEIADLRVGGAIGETGRYAYGSLNAGVICNNPSNQNQVLLVHSAGLNLTIIAQKQGPAGGARNWLTRQEMVRLAESITGEATIPPDQPDPEYLTSLADARSLASFPVKTPARLPEGMNFQYAQVLSDGSRQTVILHYTDGNQDLSIRQAAGAPDSLQALELQAETYRQVTVHDRPALISQGYFDQGGWKEIPDGGDGSASLTWIEDGIVLTVGGFNGYPSAIWLEIAEGVQ